MYDVILMNRTIRKKTMKTIMSMSHTVHGQLFFLCSASRSVSCSNLSMFLSASLDACSNTCTE